MFFEPVYILFDLFFQELFLRIFLRSPKGYSGLFDEGERRKRPETDWENAQRNLCSVKFKQALISLVTAKICFFAYIARFPADYFIVVSEVGGGDKPWSTHCVACFFFYFFSVEYLLCCCFIAYFTSDLLKRYVFMKHKLKLLLLLLFGICLWCCTEQESGIRKGEPE